MKHARPFLALHRHNGGKLISGWLFSVLAFVVSQLVNEPSLVFAVELPRRMLLSCDYLLRRALGHASRILSNDFRRLPAC